MEKKFLNNYQDFKEVQCRFFSLYITKIRNKTFLREFKYKASLVFERFHSISALKAKAVSIGLTSFYEFN